MKHKRKKGKALGINAIVTKQAAKSAFTAKNNLRKAEEARVKAFIEKGDAVIGKFMKTSSKFHLSIHNLIPVYQTCIKKIHKTKSDIHSALVWGVKQMSVEQGIARSLLESVAKNDPMPLWSSLVHTINWLKSKK